MTRWTMLLWIQGTFMLAQLLGNRYVLKIREQTSSLKHKDIVIMKIDWLLRIQLTELTQTLATNSTSNINPNNSTIHKLTLLHLRFHGGVNIREFGSPNLDFSCPLFWSFIDVVRVLDALNEIAWYWYTYTPSQYPPKFLFLFFSVSTPRSHRHFLQAIICFTNGFKHQEKSTD